MLGSTEWCEMNDGTLPCFMCIFGLDSNHLSSIHHCTCDPKSPNYEQNVISNQDVFIRSRLRFIKTLNGILIEICKKQRSLQPVVVRFIFYSITESNGLLSALQNTNKTSNVVSSDLRRMVIHTLVSNLCQCSKLNDSEIVSNTWSIEGVLSTTLEPQHPLETTDSTHSTNHLVASLLSLHLLDPTITDNFIQNLFTVCEENAFETTVFNFMCQVVSGMLGRTKKLAVKSYDEHNPIGPNTILHVVFLDVVGRLYHESYALRDYRQSSFYIRILGSLSNSIRDGTLNSQHLLQRLLFVLLELFVSTARERTSLSQIGAIINLLNSINKIIGDISAKIDKQFNNTKLLTRRKLFRDVWMYNTLFFSCPLANDFDKRETYKTNHFGPLSSISPAIVVGDHLRELLFYSDLKVAGTNGGRGLRIKEIAFGFATSDDEKAVLGRLSPSGLLYLLAVKTLESCRVTYKLRRDDPTKTENPFEKMFEYLEDPYIQSDKSNIWICIKKIAELCFNSYVTSMKMVQLDADCEIRILQLSYILLHRTCHFYFELSKLSVQLLNALLNKTNFPIIIWNYKFLEGFMDYFQLSSLSAPLNTINDKNVKLFQDRVLSNFVSIVAQPSEKHRSLLNAVVTMAMDHPSERAIQLKELSNLWDRIISEATSYAPLMTKSHIQNYLFRTSSVKNRIGDVEQFHSHPALMIAVNIISGGNKNNMLEAPITEGHSHHLRTTGSLVHNEFFPVLLSKSYSIGYIHGMDFVPVNDLLNELENQIRFHMSGVNEIIQSFTSPTANVIVDCIQTTSITMKTNNKESNGEPFPASINTILFRISALLVYHKGVRSDAVCEKRLLNMIAWIPGLILTKEAVLAAVECWTWLLSARPDLSLSLLEKINDSWKNTVQTQRGIFSHEVLAENQASFDGPLCSGPPKLDNRSNQEKNGLSSCTFTDLVMPHLIWLTFIDEQVKLSLLGNPQTFHMFVDMLHHSLGIHHTGERRAYSTDSTALSFKSDSVPTISTNIAAVGPLFKLLLIVMRCVQHGVNESNRSNQLSALKERVIATITRYFSGPPQFPMKDMISMLDDIETLSALFSFLKSEQPVEEFSTDSEAPNRMVSMIGEYHGGPIISNIAFRSFTDIFYETYMDNFGYVKYLVRFVMSNKEGECTLSPKKDHMIDMDVDLIR
ncbi:hypothetical protein ACOME3_009558 [Neoechinorhynchus agilis]